MKNENDTKKMIGYCGYNCHLCAARSDDPQIRQKLVDGWKRIFGHQHYTAENVLCDGCKSDGKVADKQCKARPCAREKGYEFCAQCDEFPCDKVRHLLASKEGLLIFCRPKDGGVTEEEYNLCMRQFDSMRNNVDQSVKAGKLPSWVKEVVSKE
jgi:hypothetical protein